MFVWIKGRPFLLVMDLTASIRTHNKTQFFVYYFYYIGFWARHSKSSPTSHTYLLVPIITLQVTTPKPIRHLLSSLCSGPHLALGVPSPHLDSYENPSYLQAHFCHVPHNLIFLFIFIIIPLLLQLSFTYSFLITLSAPWRDTQHLMPPVHGPFFGSATSSTQLSTRWGIKWLLNWEPWVNYFLLHSCYSFFFFSFLLFYSYFSICTFRTCSFFSIQSVLPPFCFWGLLKYVGEDKKKFDSYLKLKWENHFKISTLECSRKCWRPTFLLTSCRKDARFINGFLKFSGFQIWNPLTNSHFQKFKLNLSLLT